MSTGYHLNPLPMTEDLFIELSRMGHSNPYVALHQLYREYLKSLIVAMDDVISDEDSSEDEGADSCIAWHDPRRREVEVEVVVDGVHFSTTENTRRFIHRVLSGSYADNEVADDEFEFLVSNGSWLEISVRVLGARGLANAVEDVLRVVRERFNRWGDSPVVRLEHIRGT